MNRLYPQPEANASTFDERWALPVEAPAFNTAIDPDIVAKYNLAPAPVPQPDWMQAEAEANLAARGPVPTPETIPNQNSSFKFTPVDFNPFAQSNRTPSETELEQLGTRANRGIGVAKDILTDTWPAHMVKSATTLPGDVLTGAEPIRDAEGRITDKIVERSGDVAGLGASTMFAAVRPGVASLGSGPVRPIGEVKAPRFYSAVENAVVNSPQESMLPSQWLGPRTERTYIQKDPKTGVEKPVTEVKYSGVIGNQRGVKPEELEWMGLPEWLNEKANGVGRNRVEPVTRQEVQEFINNNKVEIKEVTYGKDMRDETKPDAIAEQQHLPRWNELVAKQRRLEPLINDRGRKFSQKEHDEAMAQHRAVGKEMDKLHDRMVTETFERSGMQVPKGLPKYKDYQLPGATNYRELLLTLPIKEPRLHNFIQEFKNDILSNVYTVEDVALARRFNPQFKETIKNLNDEQALIEINRARKEPQLQESYRSSHWPEKDVLAHVRMNDRIIDSKKALHLEEIQSDWHQTGRDQGYKINQTMQVVPVEGGFKIKRPDGQLVGRSIKNADGTYGDLPYKTKDEAEKLVDLMRQMAPSKAQTGVPDAPFKKTWHELALKRMLREAAEKNYERLSWAPGEANRTNPKNLEGGGTGEAAERAHRGLMEWYNNIVPKALEKIGKEWGVKVKRAKRENEYTLEQAPSFVVRNTKSGRKSEVFASRAEAEEALRTKFKTINKDDLEVLETKSDWNIRNQKNEIVKTFSHKDIADKYIEKYNNQSAPLFYIDIPPAMRESVMTKGQPLFAGGLPYSFVPVDGNPFEPNQSHRMKRFIEQQRDIDQMYPTGHSPADEPLNSSNEWEQDPTKSGKPDRNGNYWRRRT